MPFGQPFDEYYNVVLKPTLQRSGYTVVRGDDMFASRPIMADIARQIANADIILSECTGRNANVFYELGMAHAVGKHVVLITQNVSDIPFDLRHLRHIYYAMKRPRWEKALSDKITRAVKEIETSGLDADPPPIIPLMTKRLAFKDFAIITARLAVVRYLSRIAGYICVSCEGRD